MKKQFSSTPNKERGNCFSSRACTKTMRCLIGHPFAIISCVKSEIWYLLGIKLYGPIWIRVCYFGGHINPLVLQVEALHLTGQPHIIFDLAIGGDDSMIPSPVVLRHLNASFLEANE